MGAGNVDPYRAPFNRGAKQDLLDDRNFLETARRLKGGPSEAIDRILHPAGSDLARPLRDLHPTDQTAEFPSPRPLRPRPSPKPDDRGGLTKRPGDSRKREGGKR